MFVSMDSNRASNFPRRGKLLMAEAVKVRDGVDGSHPALKIVRVVVRGYICSTIRCV